VDQRRRGRATRHGRPAQPLPGTDPVLHQRLHDQGWPAILATGARGVAEARRDGVQVLSRLAACLWWG
jgi:hypothetical protein